MFSLIITIVCVVLVALLALATIYYGGDLAFGGQQRATTTKVLQEGNQVVGALELYKADTGSFPTGTSEEIKQLLVNNNYLKQMPAGEWTFRNDYAVRTDLTESACLTLNRKMGINSVPVCTDPAFEGRTVCCSNG